MITLQPSMMIGKGLHRECFTHPNNSNLCIKVVVNGNQKETTREQGYYKFLERRKIAWNMLPKFHNNIETNMGPGAVFDLIRDYNGNISNSLEYYLNDKVFTDTNRSNLLLALDKLKVYLLENNIITMPIKSKNILYQIQENTSGTLYVVDNIGNADFFPLATYLPSFGRKKILRRWNRFFNALNL